MAGRLGSSGLSTCSMHWILGKLNEVLIPTIRESAVTVLPIIPSMPIVSSEALSSSCCPSYPLLAGWVDRSPKPIKPGFSAATFAKAAIISLTTFFLPSRISYRLKMRRSKPLSMRRSRRTSAQAALRQCCVESVSTRWAKRPSRVSISTSS